MNTYDFGAAVVLSANFTSTTLSAPVDPTTVTLRILDPANVETTKTGSDLTRSGVGQYSYTVIADIVGVWRYRWEGSGAVSAVQDSVFCVASTPFTDAAA